jgi:Asp-tRNA(Asn)/Glu-tRNA(Gln) amidotransferase A subunit family amidase
MYESALELRSALQVSMRKALPPAVLMVLPVLAGAAPKVRSYSAPLDKQAASMARLSQHFMAFVAMAGCPAAVLPVPALNKRGVPWAVLMLGSVTCDVLLAKYAVKMGAHIQRTAALISDVRSSAFLPSPSYLILNCMKAAFVECFCYFRS